MGDSTSTDSSLVIGELSPQDQAWKLLTSSAAGATPVHDPTISHVAALASGCRWVGLGAWRGGQLVGGVAVVVNEHDDVWPRSLAPYNGPLVLPMPQSRPQTRHRHESAIAGALLEELAARHRSVTVRMRPRSLDIRKLVQSGWNLTSSFTYEVAISDPEQAWRNLDDNRRRLVRRAERHGCVVQEVHDLSASVIDDVTRLHLLMRDGYRKSTDLDADSWSDALQTLFGVDLARLFTVTEADGEVVGFVLATATSPVSTVLASGADPGRIDSGAGALLRWKMHCELSADGVASVDLNGARIGPEGRFKASFGGELMDRWELTSPSTSLSEVPLRRSGPRIRNAARALFGQRDEWRSPNDR